MHQKSFGILLSIFAALFGFGLVSTVVAQTVTPPVVKGSGKNLAHATIMGELRTAHKLLAEADRDYDGHRAKAAEEVHNALKELGYHHHHHPKTVQPGAATPEGTVATTKVAPVRAAATHEPQANSDTQLRQAQQVLQGVLTQLNSSHHKAAAKVNAAIAEINTALSIK